MVIKVIDTTSVCYSLVYRVCVTDGTENVFIVPKLTRYVVLC